MNGSGSGNLDHFFARFHDLIGERNHFFLRERERELNHFFRELPIPWLLLIVLKDYCKHDVMDNNIIIKRQKWPFQHTFLLRHWDSSKSLACCIKKHDSKMYNTLKMMIYFKSKLCFTRIIPIWNTLSSWLFQKKDECHATCVVWKWIIVGSWRNQYGCYSILGSFYVPKTNHR